MDCTLYLTFSPTSLSTTVLGEPQSSYIDLQYPANEAVCGTDFTHTATLIKSSGADEDDPLCVCPLDDFGQCPADCLLDILKNDNNLFAWLEYNLFVTYEGRTVHQV